MDEPTLRAEIVRLNKIIQALMNRAERSMSIGTSDFSRFQTAIMLDEQVRRRTEELETALRTNEKILRALRESEAKFHGLVDQSLVGIAIILDGKFSHANPKLASIFGYSVDELLQLGPLDVVVEHERSLVTEHILKGIAGETKDHPAVYLGLRKDGTCVHVEIASSPMSIAGKPALIAVLTDISERVQAETNVRMLNSRLHEMAIHDALTGLFNRRYLDETFERELIRAARQHCPISVVMGDLDHFKTVNDTYGHQAGDEVLREFGRLMKQHARGSDIYCRYGGEEFLLILPDMPEETACERAEQLRAALAATPIMFGTTAIRVTASFGVAGFPLHGKTADELITAADDALYAAKRSGRNQVKCGVGTT
ncbi:MAG: GGDEF domain-containing protein [Hydrogenophilales bacterium]|nr:GGDEF domain-containing protein [Hydrogenophilales bacterium]